jgi:hypothetical protein
MITNDHLTGFAAGVVLSAVAFYWYDQNRDRVDQFLQAQRMGSGQPGVSWGQGPQPVPMQTGGSTGGQTPSLEELMRQKEQLEDMIAELMAAHESQAS